MNIEFNDANMLDTQGSGWFVGFSEWLCSNAPGMPSLRHMPQDAQAHGMCMKWMSHHKGDPRGVGKPCSEGRTLSILVSERGRFRLQFSPDPQFPSHDTVEHVLQRHGQFSVWGAGIYHRWFVDEDCTLLTLRWVPD